MRFPMLASSCGLLIAIAVSLLADIQHAQAVTRVFVQNNTSFTFSIQTRQHGTSLSGSRWRQVARVVNPGQRIEVLWFNRDSGITNGREFFFDTTLGSALGPIILKQRLRGSLVNSHMWQSLSARDINHNWSDDRSTHQATLVAAGTNVSIRYRAFFAGTDDNVEYILSAERPIPGSTKGTGNLSVNVLAYNIYMRPTAITKNGQEIRARLLPARLRGFDAIIFSEAFDDDARRTLLNGLRGEYPNHTRVVGSDRGIEQDGGVMIVSRWPILAQDQRRFRDVCSGTDCAADKGVIYALLNINGFRAHIFGSHTQANPGKSEQAIRQRQFQIIADFIRSKNIPANEPVLIGGDLNVDRLRFPDEFRAMLRTLNAAMPPALGHGFTYDPQTNALATRGARSEYLDYVLFQTSHLAPPISSNEVRVLRSTEEWKEFFWEKAIWDLSDHYPVLGHFQFPTTPRPPAVSAACRQYAGEALRILTLARDTYRCSAQVLSGPRWTAEFQAHANWCMTVPVSARNSEAAARTKIMHECRLGRDPGNPTLQAAVANGRFHVRGAGFAINAPVILVLSGAAVQTPRIASANGERIIANATGSIAITLPLSAVCKGAGSVSIHGEDGDGIRKTKVPAVIGCGGGGRRTPRNQR